MRRTEVDLRCHRCVGHQFQVPVLAIGNPDDPASHFAQICKPGSGWHVITVSAFDNPADTGEKVPAELLPRLVSPEWVE